MDKQHKNEEDASLSKNDPELNEFADFAMLSLEASELEEDPLNEYLQRLRGHFQAKNPNAFRARFLKGYKVLLEELTKEC